MERKIGEIFESNGVKLVCAKGAVDASTDCRNCYFFNKNKSNNQCLGYLCAGSNPVLMWVTTNGSSIRINFLYWREILCI